MAKNFSDGVFPMVMLWWISTFIFFIQLWVIYNGMNDDKIQKWCENADTNGGGDNAEKYKGIMKNFGVAVMGIMAYWILLSLGMFFVNSKSRSINLMYSVALFIFMIFLTYIYGSTTVFYDKVKDSLCGRFRYGGFDGNNVQGGHVWVIDSGCEWSCKRDDKCAKQNGTEYACSENDFKACDDPSKLAESGCGQCYKPGENYPDWTTVNLVGSWIFFVGIIVYAIRDKGVTIKKNS